MKLRFFASFAAALILLPAAATAQGVSASDEVDESIERGLAYLAAVQNEDGSFPFSRGKHAAISALAGMAFLAKGYTPGSDRYGDQINRCIDFLLSIADFSDGFLGKAAQGNDKMYTHSICTLFLSEVSGMVDEERQRKLDALLPLSVKVLLDAQNIRKNEVNEGGWRYQRNANDSDMSCSGWALMALRSCRQNGGQVPDDAIPRALKYVKRQYNQGEGSFQYQAGNNSYGVTLTGAGILCLELCGKHNDPFAIKAAAYLRRVVYRELMRQSSRCYGLYYTAQGLFQMGGEEWKEFENWMYREWIPRQKSDGSWSEEENSPPYSTAMVVLSFAVPYRQLPIYQRDETVDED